MSAGVSGSGLMRFSGGRLAELTRDQAVEAESPTAIRPAWAGLRHEAPVVRFQSVGSHVSLSLTLLVLQRRAKRYGPKRRK